jgi:hypothetical protein
LYNFSFILHLWLEHSDSETSFDNTKF